MKTIIAASLVLAVCLCSCPAFAEATVTGSVSVGVMGSDTDNPSAKFDEYSDRSDGIRGDVELNAFKERHYLRLDAGNIGRLDESYLLRGGQFGSFNYSLFYDEIPHNLSAGASSFYGGVGGGYLSNTGVAADPTRWNEVDYRRDRQLYGFDGEITFGSPFHLRLGALEKNTDGIYPLAGNSTFSSFGRTTELPSPVDWKETAGFAEAGYRTRGLAVEVRAEFSDFNNRNEEFFWEDDFATNPGIAADATTGPPDNDFWKVSGQLVWRTPALSSSLALRGSFSQLESANDIRTVVADDTAGANVLAIEPEKFDGDITYGTLDASWRIMPVDRLDLKAFFKYLDKNNDNTVVDITAGGGTAETEVFDYSKWSAGLDASYGLAGRTSLDGGYAFTSVDREGRLDSKGSDDNLLYLQLRNRSLELLELRARYEYLDRRDDFSPSHAGDSPTDAEYIRNFLRRFDTADLVRQRAEVEAAAFVADGLGLSLEFGWQDDDYDKTDIGLTGISHYDVYLSADYGGSGKYSVGAYAGYERDKTDMASRRYNPGDIADPSAGRSSSNAYNWTEDKEFDTVAWGLYFDLPLGRKLSFSANWDMSDVDGKAEFSSQGPALEDMGEVEDYTIQELNVNLTYAFTGRMSLRLGYTYEKFDLDDNQWDGYEPLPTTSILSGAYADSDYEASIVFLETSYRF